MIILTILLSSLLDLAKHHRHTLGVVILSGCLTACTHSDASVRSSVPLIERPKVALLPFDLGVEITKLSSVKTVTEELSSVQEASMIEEETTHIRSEARRLLYQRLMEANHFTIIPLEMTDSALSDLGLKPGEPVTPEHLTEIQLRLGVYLIIAGTVLDYGKVRWQWMAAGVLGDMTWESIALGLATSWNPIALLANTGYILATSTPIWFGGGYLFGAAFRPVRVEVSAYETLRGEEVWSDMVAAIYAKERLDKLPEEQRSKKEVQLHVNLATAMEEVGDSLLDAEITQTTLWMRRLPEREVVAF